MKPAIDERLINMLDSDFETATSTLDSHFIMINSKVVIVPTRAIAPLRFKAGG
jgi:hypothetical protein